MKIFTIYDCMMYFEIIDMRVDEVNWMHGGIAIAISLSSADEELIIKFFTLRGQNKAGIRASFAHKLSIC